MNFKIVFLLFGSIIFFTNTLKANSNSKKELLKEYYKIKEGSTNYLLKNDPNFVKSIKKEISVARKLSVDSLTTNSYVLAISFYFRNRNSIQALKLIHEAEVYFKKKNKEQYTAILYTLLSGFYLRQNDFVLGEKMSRKAVFLLKNEKGGVDYSLCLTNIGTALLEQKKYKEAIYYFNKSVKQIKPSLKDHLLYRQIEVVTLSSISMCYSRLYVTQKAQKYLEEAKFKLDKLPKNDSDLVGSRYVKAQVLVFENENNIEMALNSSIQGIKISDRIPWYKLFFLNKAIEIYKLKNDSKNALKYALIKSDFSEQTVKNDQKEMLNISRVNFKLAENEKINSLKNKTLELNSINWQKQRNLLAIIALMVLLISVLIWRNIQLKTIKIKSENSRIKIEKQLAIDDLDKNKKELSVLTLKHAHSNDILSSICFELESKKSSFKNDQLLIINKTIKKLRNNYSKEWWKEFEFRFNSANSQLIHVLNKNYPNLTRNEKRLSAFLIMDLSTKEIAHITGQSINSITMARIRLRKKLDLTNDTISLSDFLNRLN